jgi:hypothetical protein
LKPNFQNTILLLILALFLTSCDYAKPIDSTNLLANYERDKFVATGTTKYFRNAIDNSGGWIIRLNNEIQFTFRGTDKIINGVWSVDKKDGEDYFVKFIYQNDTTRARLNGTIIYFDGPHRLFDSLFKCVIFVQTTRKIE